MDETLFIIILKNISIFASVVGILAGLDLLSGAKVVSSLKKILDKVFAIDQIIIRISSALRKELDNGVNIDKLLIKTKARIILGAVLLLFSLLMVLLVVTTR